MKWDMEKPQRFVVKVGKLYWTEHENAEFEGVVLVPYPYFADEFGVASLAKEKADELVERGIPARVVARTWKLRSKKNARS